MIKNTNGIQEVSGSIPLISTKRFVKRTATSLENHWFSRLFAVLRYFYFVRYFSDQSFDQNYEMSKKSNLFQEVGGSILSSRFFHLILATSHSVSLS